MPGIAGIVDFNQDRASTDTQIRRMMKILKHTSLLDEEIRAALLKKVNIVNQPGGYHETVREVFYP